MVVSHCDHSSYHKNGKTKSGAERYRCALCGKSWTAFTQAFEGMRIGMDAAVQIVGMLCEGVSVRATARLTGVDKNTIIQLAVLVGERCEAYLTSRVRRVQCDDVQCDEIWQFIYCKRHTAKRERFAAEFGDSYCFTAIERNTKLLITWQLSSRNELETLRFAEKLKYATRGRFHLSTDGWKSYPHAVKCHLAGRVDYGVLIKNFADETREDRRRYSPPRIISTTKHGVMGAADDNRICTSHAERMNGSIRNFCKRMGRLTYCFSKRWRNHKAALAMFFCHYNFCRKHNALKGKTPAMAHGLEKHVWTVQELLEKVMQALHT